LNFTHGDCAKAPKFPPVLTDDENAKQKFSPFRAGNMTVGCTPKYPEMTDVGKAQYPSFSDLLYVNQGYFETKMSETFIFAYLPCLVGIYTVEAGLDA